MFFIALWGKSPICELADPGDPGPPGVSQLHGPSAFLDPGGVHLRRRAASAALGDPRPHTLRVGTGAEGADPVKHWGGLGGSLEWLGWG